MTLDPRFCRAGAIASLLAAVAVLVAQFGLAGYPSPGAPEEVAELYADPLFRAQRWTLLLQVVLMFGALWACTLRAYRLSPTLVLTGFLFFLLWQVLELVPRSIDLFALSYGWAPEYLASRDPGERAGILEAMRRTGAALGALGHPRRAAWALGHLAFGAALWRGPGLARAVGLLFLLNALRLGLRLAGDASGWSWPGAVSGGTVGFVATIVPLFVLLGWWLWRDAAGPGPQSTAKQ